MTALIIALPPIAVVAISLLLIAVVVRTQTIPEIKASLHTFKTSGSNKRQIARSVYSSVARIPSVTYATVVAIVVTSLETSEQDININRRRNTFGNSYRAIRSI